MISVFIHNSFVKEKKYILDFILSEVLGLEYQLIADNVKSYRIVEANSRLIIADSFFSDLKEDYPYYKDADLIPESVVFADYPALDVFKLPVLFGEKGLKSEDEFLQLDNDLFAGAFFMLTRWEEIAVSKEDTHGRFIETENLSVKNAIHLRPVVNEYIDFLVLLLNKSGISCNGVQRKYQVFLTHDVDDIARYNKISGIVKALAGDIIKRRSVKTFFGTLKDCYRIRFKGQPDVYDTFDYLMDISDRKGVKSRFYFIPGLPGEEDVRFDIRSEPALKAIERIKTRNHIVGIHPSYSSYCNKKQLESEKKRMEKYSDNIEEGRQHYLRFKNPQSWQDWDDCSLKTDSSIGFYENIGFRSGICFSYPVFNVVTREKLNLRERPLIVMDTALRRCAGTKENSVSMALEMAEITKKYNGDFVLLWHNSNLSVNEWQGWNEVYKKITESI